MTSAWREPSGWDDRSENGGAERDDAQLDLFEILPHVGDTAIQPLASGDDDSESPFLELYGSGPAQEAPEESEESGCGDLEIVSGPFPAVGLLKTGVSEDEDLRRLEESIRWLVAAGAATERPVPARLAAVEVQDDDALLLDPDTLFPPRRRSSISEIAAGAAKILLVSAVAAPTAYFVASWLQIPGPVTSSSRETVAAVAMPVALSEEDRVAALPAPPLPSTSEVATPAQPEHAATLPRAANVVVEGPKAAPEMPAAAAETVAAAATPPMPVVLPAKPAMRPEEIAMMVEKGRVLFEAGDLAAARLFFRRAAAAGDTDAALAMGATYDPEVLSQRFIRGIEGDAQEAERWYEKARTPGQPQQQQRIEMVAQRR